MDTLQKRWTIAAIHSKVSQDSIAESLGILKQTVSSIKNGLSKGYKHRARIAELLQVAPEWLWNGSMDHAPAWAVARRDLQGQIYREIHDGTKVRETGPSYDPAFPQAMESLIAQQQLVIARLEAENASLKARIAEREQAGDDADSLLAAAETRTGHAAARPPVRPVSAR